MPEIRPLERDYDSTSRYRRHAVVEKETYTALSGTGETRIDRVLLKWPCLENLHAGVAIKDKKIKSRDGREQSRSSQRS